MKYKLIFFLTAITLLAGCGVVDKENEKQSEEPIIEEEANVVEDEVEAIEEESSVIEEENNAEEKETNKEEEKEVKEELTLNERITQLKDFYETVYRVESKNYETKLETIMVYGGINSPIEATIVTETFDNGKRVDRLHLEVENTEEKFDYAEPNEIGNGLYQHNSGYYLWKKDGYTYELSGSYEEYANDMVDSYQNQIKANGEMDNVTKHFENEKVPSYIPEGFKLNYVEIRKDFEDSIFISGNLNLLYGLQNDKYDVISVSVSTGFAELPNVENIVGVTSTKQINDVVVAYKETSYSKQFFFVVKETLYALAYDNDSEENNIINIDDIYKMIESIINDK